MKYAICHLILIIKLCVNIFHLCSVAYRLICTIMKDNSYASGTEQDHYFKPHCLGK